MGRAEAGSFSDGASDGPRPEQRREESGVDRVWRITPNLFGISFGITGLAQAWGSAARLYDAPAAPSDGLFLVAAVVYGITLLSYVGDVVTTRRVSTELQEPITSPFLALAGAVPMLLGVALADHAHDAGVAVFAVSLAVTVVIGGLLIGQWVVSGIPTQRWHPGYFLPTAASGYLGALASSALGYPDLAMAMFGYGTLSWLLLGSLPTQRSLTPPGLPGPLIPTTAILLAPPAVAGVAWFEMSGGRVDAVALGLGGYLTLMVLVQVRAISIFRTAPFGPGSWAFSFPYAAVTTDAIRWLSAERVADGEVWAYLLLTAISAGVLGLAWRTAAALTRGTFLPSAPAAPSPPNMR